MDIWNNISCDYNLLPSPEMSNGERLNCMTRFIILIAFFMYVCIPSSNDWLYFFLLSMGLILTLWYFYPYFHIKESIPVPKVETHINEDVRIKEV